MNLKKLGILLSLSTLVSINLTTTNALTQEDPAWNVEDDTQVEEPSIQFGEAISQGKCTIANQLAGEDGRTLAIALDGFVAENGQRNKCLLRINTTIPGGFHVQDVQVLYQGTAEIPEGENAIFSRSYIFNGGAFGQVKAEPQKTKFVEDNPLFQEQDNLTAASVSACGGQGQLGINMIARSSKEAALFVDTADVNAGDVQLHFDIVPCDTSNSLENPNQVAVGLK
ncbi:DUF4360 domain-containing protein [Pleurocapsa sp. PCC 7319]|uniref:DUF4360 domain-containing protein n=1 Tax=Pleurocapsa sp. PCC 7319 TaxID=118161 RepID=UPI0003616597|nr:DUF4360 domain-containing protein [Pleurocapsa sp. PCC 7319]